MPETRDFGKASLLEADAIGPPGKRRFRLLILSNRGTAWLWLEKEQLQALGAVTDQLLTGLPALWTLVRPEAKVREPSPEFTRSPTIELTVGHLTLESDEAQQRFVLQIHDTEADPQEPPTLRCRVTRQQLIGLGDQVVALSAAGRQRCPSCGALLVKGEAHTCPGSNGHRPDTPID